MIEVRHRRAKLVAHGFDSSPQARRAGRRVGHVLRGTRGQLDERLQTGSDTAGKGVITIRRQVGCRPRAAASVDLQPAQRQKAVRDPSAKPEVAIQAQALLKPLRSVERILRRAKLRTWVPSAC